MDASQLEAMQPDPGSITYEAAMDLALQSLALRSRSRAQVDVRLRRAGASEAVAEDVIARLEELGILDDRTFALAGVESGVRTGLASGYLQAQLEGRGVPAEDAAWALEETGISASDAARALRLAEGWVRAHPSETGVRGLRRLGSLLVRKGYDEELAADVCRRVLGDLPEPETGND
jgi:regulatory protein